MVCQLYSQRSFKLEVVKGFNILQSTTEIANIHTHTHTHSLSHTPTLSLLHTHTPLHTHRYRQTKHIVEHDRQRFKFSVKKIS